MGLDNLPAKLPCVTQKTAIYVDGDPEGVVDCAETAEACGCPFNVAKGRPETGAVHGIFGSPCWYRGKYGNSLLEKVLGIAYDESEGMSFYGSNADGTYKSAAECLDLAETIEDAIAGIEWVDDPSKFDYIETGVEAVSVTHKNECEYAAWWLRWVAENADGSYCWY
jgi:hypothetical protein